jgi:anti-sigma B factor antagonist
MGIQIEEQDDYLILTPDYKLLGGQEANELIEQIKAKIEKTTGSLKIIVNFKSLKWANSSGLGIFMNVLNLINEHNGSMRLVELDEKIENLLKITKLISVFEINSSIDEAKQNF